MLLEIYVKNPIMGLCGALIWYRILCSSAGEVERTKSSHSCLAQQESDGESDGDGRKS